MASKYYIYRFLNRENEIIYVGRTSDLEVRMKNHFGSRHHRAKLRNKATRKVQYAEMECRAFGVIFEIYLLNLWKPKYNTMNKYEEEMSRELLSVDHLEWIDFDSEELNVLKTREIKRREKKVRVKNFTKEEIDFLNRLKQRGIHLTESERKILISIHRVEGGYIDSINITSQCMISRKTLHRATDKFLKHGLVEVEKTRFKNGIYGANKFKLAQLKEL